MRRSEFLVAMMLLSACDDGPPAPSASAQDDVRTLRLLMIEDPALQPLDEVDRVASDRPVLASRLLRTGALPAARQQLERVEGASLRSEEGQRIGRQAVRAYRERVAALETYEAVLAREARDTDALLRAIRAQTAAQRSLLAVHDALDAIVALPEEERPEPSPDDVLEDDELSEDEAPPGLR